MERTRNLSSNNTSSEHNLIGNSLTEILLAGTALGFIVGVMGIVSLTPIV